jgi:hypothetical protein
MRARVVELGDDIRDCVADSWDLREAAFSDDLVQRHHKSAKAVSRAGIGLGPVWIATAQGCARGEFPEQLDDGSGIHSHIEATHKAAFWLPGGAAAGWQPRKGFPASGWTSTVRAV